MATDILTILLVIAGAALVVAGVAMVYAPAGFIAAGLCLFGGGRNLAKGVTHETS